MTGPKGVVAGPDPAPVQPSPSASWSICSSRREMIVRFESSRFCINSRSFLSWASTRSISALRRSYWASNC
jgi:hypothetical protein